MHRRQFLRRASSVSAGLFGLRAAVKSGALSALVGGDNPAGYGPLVPDPNGILDLPAGFSYSMISRAGDAMTDGLVVPDSADGMGAFPGPTPDHVVVIRNHELDIRGMGPFGANYQQLSRLTPSQFYDFRRGAPTLGGTTSILFNTRTQRLEYQWLSLAGTMRNCGGGITPWNSWITCEEHTQVADSVYERDHGFAFEVPATAARPVEPVPLRAMGRFNRESVAVDPSTGIVYQTEDRHDSCIYRFIPNRPGHLRAGGRVQALAIAGTPQADLRNWGIVRVPEGSRLPVTWIDLDEVDSPRDDLRHQSVALGAAVFARGEGMWWGLDEVYFSCTSGGPNHAGQIFALRPNDVRSLQGEDELELFLEPNDSAVLENNDALTVAPWNDLFVCEDGGGEQFIVQVTPSGGVHRFARNALNDAEFNGATFSPDGSTLFCNIQTPGITLAITGPF